MAKNQVDAMWLGGDRRAALRYRNFEEHQRAGAKIRLGAEKTTGNSQRTSPSSSMAAGVHSGLYKSKVMSRRCLGRRCQTRKTDTHCSGVKRSSKTDEGEAVAAAAAREGSEMTATSGTFLGGETAGALFVPWKMAMGARHQWGVGDS